MLPMSGCIDRPQSLELLMDSAVIHSLTGMVVPLFGMMLPIAIVALVVYARGVSSRQRYDMIARLLEKGLPVPPELLESGGNAFGFKSAKPSTLWGPFTLVGLGIGLIVYFLSSGGDNWGLGAIPLAVGLAQLLAWKLEQPKAAGAQE